MNENYLELLQLLKEHKVKYLVIGGYAVINYCEPRYTKDIDIWIEASTTNAKKMYPLTRSVSLQDCSRSRLLNA